MIGLVVESKLKQGKQANYWCFDIKTEQGIIQANIWLDNPNIEVPAKADLINIIHYKDQRDTKFHNIIIEPNGFKKISHDSLDEETKRKILDIPYVQDEKLAYYLDYILDKNKYEDQNIYKFVIHCLSTLPENSFITTPAAKGVHHAYRGGLLEHTFEVFSIALGISNAFPYINLINKDLILASAALHDIGKTQTYYIDEVGYAKSRSEESLCGHTAYSLMIVKNALNTFNLELKGTFSSELLHSIASHHGRTEFRAITEPMTLEAVIVSQADYLSAKGAAIQGQINNINKSKSVEMDDLFRLHGNTYYTSQALRSELNNN